MLRHAIRFTTARLYTHGTADNGRRWCAVLQVDDKLPLRTVVGTWTSYDLTNTSPYERNVMAVVHATYALSNNSAAPLPNNSELIVLNNDPRVVREGNTGWPSSDKNLFRWIKELRIYHAALNWHDVDVRYEVLPGKEIHRLFGQVEKFGFDKHRF
jgi:hypothetical protein